MSGKKGFTLVELMVSILCLAILMTLTVPDWISTTWPRYRLKNAARQIVSDIRRTQALAAARNRQYRLVFDAAFDVYRIERGNLSSGSSSWGPESVRAIGTGDTAGVDILEETDSPVVISPTGGMSAGAVILRNPPAGRTRIVFSTAGRVRMIREEE